MAIKDDFTGQRFGKLVAIKKSDVRKNGSICWECKCDCGNTAYIRSSYLKNKRAFSCGKCSKIEDLTGQKFDMLTVIKLDNEETKKRGRSTWICLCKCGKTCSVRACDLKYGNIHSCSNCAKKNVHDSVKADIKPGDRFGMLTVLEETPERKLRRIVYKCKCDCGKIAYVTTNHLLSKNTQSCGCLSYSIGEKNIKELLDNNGIEYIEQYSFSDLIGKNNIPLKFDFALIKNNKVLKLIEFDGKRHRDTSSNWCSNDLIKNDIIKNAYCLKNEIPLYRIPYEMRDSITLEVLEDEKYRVYNEDFYNLKEKIEWG